MALSHRFVQPVSCDGILPCTFYTVIWLRAAIGDSELWQSSELLSFVSYPKVSAAGLNWFGKDC